MRNYTDTNGNVQRMNEKLAEIMRLLEVRE